LVVVGTAGRAPEEFDGVEEREEGAMSATGANIRLRTSHRTWGREALVATAALLVGLMMGIGTDHVITDRAETAPAREAAIVLPATGWATESAALRTQVNRAMNAVLAEDAAGWTTSGAELREQVNRAMNDVLARALVQPRIGGQSGNARRRAANG
jgi:hypothetical protein